jgi:hypothetical protein
MGTAQVVFAGIVTSPEVTGNDVTGTGTRIERDITSRAFYPYFPYFFGTPLDSRYEQWNFESNQS